MNHEDTKNTKEERKKRREEGKERVNFRLVRQWEWD
jgi:hypothetical protein